MGSMELRRAGLKVTNPRIKVLKVLESGEHLSAEDIYQRLLEDGESTGLATIYRVLAQFESSGMVLRHNFEGNSSVYELNDGDHHDHMVCVETGTIIEFQNEEIERLQEQIAGAHGYSLEDHSLVLYVRPLKGGARD